MAEPTLHWPRALEPNGKMHFGSKMLCGLKTKAKKRIATSLTYMNCKQCQRVLDFGSLIALRTLREPEDGIGAQEQRILNELYAKPNGAVLLTPATLRRVRLALELAAEPPVVVSAAQASPRARREAVFAAGLVRARAASAALRNLREEAGL